MFRSTLRRPKTIALAAITTTLAATAAILAISGSAGADGDLRIDTRQPMAPHAIARFNEARVAALYATAPTSVHGKCVDTVSVPGQGPSCRLSDSSLWGVRLANGATVSSHGPDVLAAAVPIIGSDASLGLSNAGNLTFGVDADFVTCTSDPRTPHYTAIYARHAGANSVNEAAMKQSIRHALRQASEFVGAQSRAQGALPGNERRLRFACTAGDDTIDVKTANVSTSGPIALSPLITAVNATGVNAADAASSRMVIFTDQQNSLGAAGQGLLYADDSPDANNNNNRADLIAVHYWANAPAAPVAYWDVFLHEIFHTMGAVQDGAPGANGEGHCVEDADVMCYDEPAQAGNVKGYATGQMITTHPVAGCATTQLDCGADTYFNAAPTIPASNWLATHWNAGSSANRWLDHGARNRDTIAPATPGTPRLVAVTDTTVTATWDPIADDIPGAVTYRLYIRVPGAGTSVRETGPSTTEMLNAQAPGSTVFLRVDASDAAGNISARSGELQVKLAGMRPSTDDGTGIGTGIGTGGGGTGGDDTAPRTPTEKPTAPKITNIAPRTGGANVSWSSVDGGGLVSSYQLVVTSEQGARAIFLPARGATTQFVPIKPGSISTVAVRALADQQQSATSTSLRVGGAAGTARCGWKSSDRSRPTNPGRPKLTKRANTSLTARFGASRDANGICAYRLMRKIKGKWTLVGAVAGSARAATFTKLPKNAAAALAVQALDASGNVSALAPLAGRTTN